MDTTDEPLVLDLINTCREEQCPILDLHEAHGTVHRARGTFFVQAEERGAELEFAPRTQGILRSATHAARSDEPPNLLRDIVYDTISQRIIKPFGAVYGDVLDTYGTISESAVYRALAWCCERRLVAAVVSSDAVAHVRAGGFTRTGYVRYDSPLLWRPGGLRDLMELACEMNQDMVDASAAAMKLARSKILRGGKKAQASSLIAR